MPEKTLAIIKSQNKVRKFIVSKIDSRSVLCSFFVLKGISCNKANEIFCRSVF